MKSLYSFSEGVDHSDIRTGNTHFATDKEDIMHFKKLQTLCVSTALVLTLAAGCSTPAPNTETTASGTKEQQVTQTEEKTEETKEESTSEKQTEEQKTTSVNVEETKTEATEEVSSIEETNETGETSTEEASEAETEEPIVPTATIDTSIPFKYSKLNMKAAGTIEKITYTAHDYAGDGAGDRRRKDEPRA